MAVNPPRAGTNSVKDFVHIFEAYDKLEDPVVAAYCSELDQCPYKSENMEDASEVIRNSIGTNLLKKACKNGNYALPGPLLLVKVLKAFSVSKHAKCVQAKNVIDGLSIKNLATLDYLKLTDDILTQLTIINSFDPNFLKESFELSRAVV